MIAPLRVVRGYRPSECKVPWCEEEAKAGGFCDIHYSRMKRWGSLGGPVTCTNRRSFDQRYIGVERAYFNLAYVILSGEPIGNRQCTRCRRWLLPSDFHKIPSGALHPHCRDCRQIYWSANSKLKGYPPRKTKGGKSDRAYALKRLVERRGGLLPAAEVLEWAPGKNNHTRGWKRSASASAFNQTRSMAADEALVARVSPPNNGPNRPSCAGDADYNRPSPETKG